MTIAILTTILVVLGIFARDIGLLRRRASLTLFIWILVSQPVEALPELTASGFCSKGVFPETRFTERSIPDVELWGSYCAHGDSDTGSFASHPFRADRVFSIYAAGYLNDPDITLQLENVQTGKRLDLHFPVEPHETWVKETFQIPIGWKSTPLRIVAEDRSTRATGWLGISDPIPDDRSAAVPTREMLFRVALTIAICVALVIPGLAGSMIAATGGLDHSGDLCTVFLLTTAALGYASFWVYFFSRPAGIFFSYFTLIGSLVLVAYIATVHFDKVRAISGVLAPVGLSLAASVFVLCLGFLHGSHGLPTRTASSRFAPPALSVDNSLPETMADAVYGGHIPKPLIGDWLSSDRPPLQAGNAIWAYGWLPRNVLEAPADRDLAYLILAVVLQCFFLIGLWIFLEACGLRRSPVTLVFVVCFLSGFSWFNCFFTWPKLYPVAFLLVLSSYLLTNRFREKQVNPIFGMCAGACAAFALLAHGGSAFALLGLATTMLFVGFKPPPRFSVACFVAAVVLYYPWMAYQKYYDPPGDRLLKWHLAGEIQPHPEIEFSTLLIEHYRQFTVFDVVKLKTSNFELLFGGIPNTIKNSRLILAPGTPIDKRYEAAAVLRTNSFLYWVTCIQASIVGPVALLFGAFCRARNTSEYRCACRIWLCTAITTVIWCVLMFGPNTTYVHQGTYLTVVFALAGSTLAMWSLNAWLARFAVLIQIVWAFLLYVVLDRSPDFGIFPTVTNSRWLAAGCVVAVFGFLFLLLRPSVKGARSRGREWLALAGPYL